MSEVVHGVVRFVSEGGERGGERAREREATKHKQVVVGEGGDVQSARGGGCG